MSETAWIAVIGMALTQLGVLVGVYVKIKTDLTAIKTRLEIDDRNKAERTKARDNEFRVLLTEHCPRMQAECPARRDFEQWSSPSQVTDPGGRRKRA